MGSFLLHRPPPLDWVCQRGVCGLVDMWAANSGVIPGFS